MNLVAAIRNYIDRILQDVGPGIKLLLMDSETTTIISMIYSQSEIFQHEVYIFENVNSINRPILKYAKCVALLRPTKENVQLLVNEFKTPKYGSYYLYFTNILMKADLKCLAESDEFEIVKDIKEFYADYIAINPFIFNLNVKKIYQSSSWSKQALSRTVDGLVGLFLSVKQKPVIRYQGNSQTALQLAESLQKQISKESELFDFRQNDTPLLLIIDRREDPVTPLLHQWTYQAMLHDLVGITNNRVKLDTAPGIGKDFKEIVLSHDHDEFFAQNMYLNFGEIGQNAKLLMDAYQQKSQNQQKIDSIADMKKFIENYPQFKKLSGNLVKHVTMLNELSRLINTFGLLEVSEIEQNIACNSTDPIKDLQEIQNLLIKDKYRESDLIRLILLYALCYENHPLNKISDLVRIIKKKGFNDKYIKLVNIITRYGGTNVRNNDLFGNQDPLAYTKKIIKGMKGIENIYTQHKSLLNDLMIQIAKCKLNENAYPYFGSSAVPNREDRFREMVIFVIGGITYEEVLDAYLYNRNVDLGLYTVQAIIGGTNIINFTMFTELLEDFAGSSNSPTS